MSLRRSGTLPRARVPAHGTVRGDKRNKETCHSYRLTFWILYRCLILSGSNQDEIEYIIHRADYPMTARTMLVSLPVVNWFLQLLETSYGLDELKDKIQLVHAFLFFFFPTNINCLLSHYEIQKSISEHLRCTKFQWQPVPTAKNCFLQ